MSSAHEQDAWAECLANAIGLDVLKDRAYFHTGARELFVGPLAAIGVFLLSYRGHQRRDDVASNLAGLCALVVAALPTHERPLAPNVTNSVTFFSDALHPDPVVVGRINFAAAALLFATLAYMSLFLFTRTDQIVPTTQSARATECTLRAASPSSPRSVRLRSSDSSTSRTPSPESCSGSRQLP